MSKTRKPPSQILHERENLRHRILIVNPGSLATGPWASNDKLAELGGWFANNGASNQLPYGVFRAVSLTSQVLA